MALINKFSKDYITEPRQIAGIKRGQAKNPVWMISPKNYNVVYTTQVFKLFTQQISNAMKAKYGAAAGMIGTGSNMNMSPGAEDIWHHLEIM